MWVKLIRCKLCTLLDPSESFKEAIEAVSRAQIESFDEMHDVFRSWDGSAESGISGHDVFFNWLLLRRLQSA